MTLVAFLAQLGVAGHHPGDVKRAVSDGGCSFRA